MGNRDRHGFQFYLFPEDNTLHIHTHTKKKKKKKKTTYKEFRKFHKNKEYRFRWLIEKFLMDKTFFLSFQF